MSKPKIERIIFLQGEQADEALELYRNTGAEGVLQYLSEWHYPGEHETVSEYGAGSSDRTYEIGGYKLTVNLNLNYIGLEYKV